MFDVIVNPVGAGWKTLSLWQEAKTILKENKAECRVHFSSREKSLSDITAEITGDGNRHDLIVIGGDGSMNEIINGIQDFHNTRIGLIPCGSANDFAKSLGIEKDLRKNVSAILEGKVKHTLDIGVLTYLNCFDENDREVKMEKPYARRFNNAGSIGFDAEICYEAEASKLKGILNKMNLGKLIYILVALKVIFQTKMVPAEIRIGNEKINYEKMLLAVGMNELYEGGGFKFAPEAVNNDGMLDLCCADHLSRFDFFRMFPYAYNGSHIRFDGVHTDRFQELEIMTKVPLWVQTDGEVSFKSSHIRINMLAEKLQMLN